MKLKSAVLVCRILLYHYSQRKVTVQNTFVQRNAFQSFSIPVVKCLPNFYVP